MLQASLTDPETRPAFSPPAVAAIRPPAGVRWLYQPSRARREAILTALSITLGFLAIINFDLGGLIFSAIEHRPDYKRDTLILTGLTMSLGFAIFAMRRWYEASREVEVRIAAEQRATQLAREDALTGLPNRRALSAHLSAAIARAERNGRALSLLLVDLDRFKPVNDLYGHIAGDRLLQEIAQRLKAIVREGEFVARLGGDEFAVTIDHARGDRTAPLTAAKRISAALSGPVSINAADILIGASAGVASYPYDGLDVEALMRRADVALYRAKDKGRGRCQLFDAAMDAEIRERAAIEADLRKAISSGEVEPYFQPLVDLRSGRIAGFEALARWRHRTQGFIPPSSFIPVAEEAGLIGELGLAILRQACRQARGWPAETIVAVNISPIQLADAALADKVLDILKAEGLPPSRLEIEITENALVGDIEGARRILGRLKSEGVSICLDDFGTGYSSLRHLSSMPFNRVKIDRAFVQGLNDNGDPLKVVRAIVSLCTSLGLATTGEGAETECHVSLLRAAGCSIVQGWYFGEAVPAGAAAKLAAEGYIPIASPHAGADRGSAGAQVVPLRR